MTAPPSGCGFLRAINGTVSTDILMKLCIEMLYFLVCCFPAFGMVKLFGFFDDPSDITRLLSAQIGLSLTGLFGFALYLIILLWRTRKGGVSKQ